jgi:hypothetical protein
MALLPYAVRATRWRPVAAGAASALIFVAGMTLAPVTLDVNGLTTVLRLAALLGAVGAAFLLDDPAESTTAATPAPRRLRMMLRPLVAAPGAVAWWACVLLVLRADADRQAWAAVPVADVSLEAAALITAAVAVAAVGVRRPPHDGGGTLAAPVVVALVIVGQLLPGRLAMFPPPGDPGWDEAHRLWAGLLPVVLGLLLWATRDPLRTRRRPT